MADCRGSICADLRLRLSSVVVFRCPLEDLLACNAPRAVQPEYFHRVCGTGSSGFARCARTSSRIAAINAVGASGGTCSSATMDRPCIPRTSEPVARRRRSLRRTSTSSIYLLRGPDYSGGLRSRSAARARARPRRKQNALRHRQRGCGVQPSLYRTPIINLTTAS